MSALFASNKKELLKREIPTLISKGCVINGTMNATAVVRIDGAIKGNVSVDEGLIVGEEGKVDGNVITKEVVVYWIINGNITAGFVEIKSSGKVKGEIVTKNLIVEKGGFYNGSMLMECAVDS